ncbi:probable serine/threonine-protein kinase DDB_G0278845 isoform X2 [Chelonus insularis]|uniref:probable serine/threonine-protein kinase DDB_G0278845 isoform X2 n=1 Tax=Chelonus insularis TaxID=460826 RepID=UPI0015883DBB|nr:probable serine/threonine-protein kinase DDB_G0278845 isoform X2 [Chelonus insularis]
MLIMCYDENTDDEVVTHVGDQQNNDKRNQLKKLENERKIKNEETDDDDDDDGDDDSENSERDDDNDVEEQRKKEDNDLVMKKHKNFIENHKLPLPTPNFNSTSNLLKTSVFSNPFVEAEKAKSAILEKHVKMTPTLDDTKMINGRKICWNYRKGRCRFGHNCTFAHDSDIHKNLSTGIETGQNLNRHGHRRHRNNCPTSTQEIVICQTNFNHYNPMQPAITNDNEIDNYDNSSNEVDDGNVDDENYEEMNDQENNDMQKRKKKKRPGLSQTLIPGKKIFKIYKAQSDISR